MADIVERLRQRPWRSAAENDYKAKERRQREREEGADEITALRAENERLRVMIDLYREAVRIDATMEGPKFMGANSSALKRVWDADRAALEEKR